MTNVSIKNLISEMTARYRDDHVFVNPHRLYTVINTLTSENLILLKFFYVFYNIFHGKNLCLLKVDHMENLM
jgi:hypothetical protein